MVQCRENKDPSLYFYSYGKYYILCCIMDFEEEKIIICRLCSQVCGKKNQSIDDSMLKMMALLLLHCNPSEGKDAVICDKCAHDLKICFEFKSSCLSTKHCINFSMSDEERSQLDRFRPNSKECHNKNSLPGHAICYLCTKLISHDLSITLTEDKKDVMLRVQLKKYFPELIPNVVQDITLCASCNISLEFYFEVMRNWSDTEKNNEVEHEKSKSMKISQNDFYAIAQCEYKSEPNADVSKDNACFDNENKDEVKLHEFFLYQPESTVEEFHIKHETDLQIDKVDTKFEEDTAVPSQSDEQNHPGLTTYQCKKCEFKTKHKSSLKRHELVHQDPSEITLYRCDTCEYKTKHKADLKQHMATTFHCDMCEYKTKRKYLFQLHAVTHQNHPPITVYQCEKCEYKTKYKDYWKKHLKIHQDRPQVEVYQCEQCEYKAKHKDTFRRHMIVSHPSSDAIMYHCEMCEYKTQLKSYLKRHMVGHQDPSEVAIYQCDKCEYRAKRKYNLKQHMMSHQEPSEATVYRCEKCDYKTRHKDTFRRHMMVSHPSSEAIVYRCEKCEYNTQLKCYLRRHMVGHQDPSEVAVYQCNKCDYRAKRKYGLKQHMMSHQDPSEVCVYQCAKCDYKSKQKRYLIRHLMAH